MSDFYSIIDKYPLHHALGGTAADGGLEQNRYELNELCKYLTEKGVKTWLEIGIAKGDLLRFMQTEMKLTAMGITPEERESHNGLTVMYGYSQSPEVIKEVNNYVSVHGKIDMIFVDGDHSYGAVKQDYENYKGLCKHMGFHDACGLRHCEGVDKFLSEIRGQYTSFKLFADNSGNRSGIAVIEL